MRGDKEPSHCYGNFDKLKPLGDPLPELKFREDVKNAEKKWKKAMKCDTIKKGA